MVYSPRLSADQGLFNDHSYGHVKGITKGKHRYGGFRRCEGCWSLCVIGSMKGKCKELYPRQRNT